MGGCGACRRHLARRYCAYAGVMSYSANEARQELLDAIAEAIDEIAVALAALGGAYELLDETTADTLEEQLFRPVQLAYGRAQRTYAAFAERHGLRGRSFATAASGLPSHGVAGFLEQAARRGGERRRAARGASGLAQAGRGRRRRAARRALRRTQAARRAAGRRDRVHALVRALSVAAAGGRPGPPAAAHAHCRAMFGSPWALSPLATRTQVPPSTSPPL